MKNNASAYRNKFRLERMPRSAEDPLALKTCPLQRTEESDRPGKWSTRKVVDPENGRPGKWSTRKVVDNVRLG